MKTSGTARGLETIGRFIGMVHLQPLPGAPTGGDLHAVERAALADARALAEGGADALIIENLGDTPYYPHRVPPVTVAAMTRVATAVCQQAGIPVGINVLRNDAEAALAVAIASGAGFIRVNVLTGARVSDQGIVQGRAHELLRMRRSLGGEHIAVLADIDVKHSAPLAAQPLAQEVADTLQRAHADAVIVTGAGTGGAIDLVTLQRVREAAGDAPVLAGSGVTPETLPTMVGLVDAFIVGTWLKRGGDLGEPVDVDRVRRLAQAIPRTPDAH